MNILKVGDSQQAACANCQSFQNMTFTLRDVPLSDESGIVENVLVGVCDSCDHVGVLPHQSTPIVQKQLQQQRRPVESRVPAHMIDILNLASIEISGTVDFVPALMKFYLYCLSNDELSAKTINDYLQTDLARGKSQKRISLKGRRVIDDIEQLKQVTNIKSTTDIIKGIVLKMNDDLLVNKNQEKLTQLRGIVAATI